MRQRTAGLFKPHDATLCLQDAARFVLLPTVYPYKCVFETAPVSYTHLASLCATAALRFDCTAEITLATSPLFLVPGVPLINGVIYIMEGHVLMGVSRLVNAMLLIVCIAVGLSATLLMVKDSLL